MHQQQIAYVLSRVSQLLEILQADPFKVKAYLRASEALAGAVGLDLARAEVRDILRVPGIGKIIAEDVIALAQTDTCQTLAEIEAQLPLTLLDVLDVQGLGPRKASLLWRELGVGDLTTLRQAAEQGKVRKLKGFGAKTEATILEEVRRIEAYAGFVTSAVALPFAEAAMAWLQVQPLVRRVAVAGSLRRWKSLVRDIDLVLELEKGSENEEVLVFLNAFPGVEKVEVKNPGHCLLRHETGIHCDLFFAEAAEWGTVLWRATGASAHVEALMERARVDEVDLGGCAREAELYFRLGLPWLPPEVREDASVLEEAEDGCAPDLIELCEIRGDLHVHSTASDGRASVEEMAAAAQAMGLDYICISDHSGASAIANGLTPSRLLEHVRRIRRVDQRREGLRVLAGCEVDILRDGSLDGTDEVFAALDFVVGSVHSAFQLDKEAMTTRLLAAIESGQIDALAHPTGRLLTRRLGYTFDEEAVFAACARCGVALEINGDPHRLDLDEAAVKRALPFGVTFIISSDAHAQDGIGQLRYGVATARRALLPAARVLNTQPVAAILAWRKERLARLRND